MKLQTSTLFAGIAVLFCIAFTEAYGQSQPAPAKFGKIEDAEMNMRTYAKDTSAAAVVLSDYGTSYFVYVKGFKVVFERHTRIKVLKKSGSDVANITVPYYKQNDKKETVHNIKGFTYNQEGGKITKDKLESKAVFDEQTSGNWHTKKFTMPNVKEGSIIEYSYSITSDFLYNLREWEFQRTIPVAYSEYNVRIPEYFVYKQEHQGYLPLNVSTSERGGERFTITWEAEIVSGLGGDRVPGGSKQIEAQNEKYRWVVLDAPALRPEKYITTLSDYQSKIEFELQSVKYPGQLPKIMTGNWSEVATDLLTSDRFGTQLNRNGAFKAEIAAIKAKHSEPEQQMAAIHALVKNTVKWNNKHGLYTSGPISKAYASGTGNAADINILLTAMLQEAGLDAGPVILSTRDHGRASYHSPMLNKFNYVIAHVAIGDKEYLLDGTDPLLPAGMLPFRCLNGQGRLIKKNDNRWVELKPSGNYTKLFNGDLTISPNGSMVGQVIESNAGYNALNLRRSILDEGEAKYAEKLSKEVGNYKVEKPVFKNLKDLSTTVDVEYTLTANGNNQAVDVIYLNPMLGQGEKDNPFKLEERAYPVDLAAPIDYTYVCRFNLPQGYDIEEAPKGMMVALPEDGGRFMYMIQKEGNVVQIMSKISILKPIYYAEEYNHLKDFYTQIVAKHAEQIVLKKVAQ